MDSVNYSKRCVAQSVACMAHNHKVGRSKLPIAIFFEKSFPKTSILEQNETRSISSYVENIFTETPNKKFDVSVNIFSTYEEIRVFGQTAKKVFKFFAKVQNARGKEKEKFFSFIFFIYCTLLNNIFIQKILRENGLKLGLELFFLEVFDA